MTEQEEEDSSDIISSLKSLLVVMSKPVLKGHLCPFSESDPAINQTHARMPPLDAVLEVLRWTRSHQNYLRVQSISQILPLQKFEDICRKVYFAVESYSEIDFVLTIGFLSYMFAEHTVAEGIASSRDHFRLCQRSLARALSLLPIMLPPSMEVIAALTLGAKGHENEQRNMEISLFWAVFKFEKGLALRLGRPSGIRDAEITLLAKPDEHRTTRIARIQGQVYDQLYSPAGLPTSAERKAQAMKFADEVRDILGQIKSEISESLKDAQADSMRATYLHSDLVCHSSILTLILRAIPSAQRSEVSDECISAARDTLDAHQQCIQSVRGCGDPATSVKYLNCIIFTCVVRTFNFEDLALLERFAASLKPETTGEDSPTHPYRLYDLLCQAARLYITKAQFSASGPTMARNDSTLSTDFEASQFFAEAAGSIEEFGNSDLLMFDASDWYQGNQQLISLLDEGRLF
ncbi:fungal specific transcription factor domain protein [Colletotrichum tofieldiae]|uniref:Fungal specific transcription factor domain protein n=1 Tax=Colletotrichum tofieldiae TaxID=708197 RepID=A0A166QME0_9PEZI|nr:fungal specific transcription factor domain protein [Colletotrichum tofieldiae]